jgi:hypothetical protein
MLLPLFAAVTLALPAYGQTPTATETPSGTTSAHGHLTMTQRFEQANTTHDGHLTLDQARAGYKSVARHFAAIDQDKKGYITEDDIRSYYKTQRALHHQSASAHHTPSS